MHKVHWPVTARALLIKCCVDCLQLVALHFIGPCVGLSMHSRMLRCLQVDCSLACLCMPKQQHFGGKTTKVDPAQQLPHHTPTWTPQLCNISSFNLKEICAVTQKKTESKCESSTAHKSRYARKNNQPWHILYETDSLLYMLPVRAVTHTHTQQHGHSGMDRTHTHDAKALVKPESTPPSQPAKTSAALMLTKQMSQTTRTHMHKGLQALVNPILASCHAAPMAGLLLLGFRKPAPSTPCCTYTLHPTAAVGRHTNTTGTSAAALEALQYASCRTWGCGTGAAIRSMQYTYCSMPYTNCSMQNTEHSLPHTGYSTWAAVQQSASRALLRMSLATHPAAQHAQRAVHQPHYMGCSTRPAVLQYTDCGVHGLRYNQSIAHRNCSSVPRCRTYISGTQ
jgi:hypothetical protein